MARMTHFEKDQIIARLNAELVALRAEVSQLRGDRARMHPAPARSAFAVKADARRVAARRILAANPGRRSVTLAEVDAYLEAQR